MYHLAEKTTVRMTILCYASIGLLSFFGEFGCDEMDERAQCRKSLGADLVIVDGNRKFFFQRQNDRNHGNRIQFGDVAE